MSRVVVPAVGPPIICALGIRGKRERRPIEQDARVLIVQRDDGQG